MAKIEDLIARIADDPLRKAIEAEIREIKKTKRFGLVFEGHIPESLRLPLLPVCKGSHVAKKGQSGKQIFRVVDSDGKSAICTPEGKTPCDKQSESIPVKDLVVVKHFGEPIFPILTPVARVARGGLHKPWHVLINADNFHALQLLLYTHERKVDVIYIDPPYNTGARDWKYNNDYVDKNDPWRHSKWLSFMQKRLQIAKKLLRPNGVLIVTIDEHEVQHLGCLLAQLFPEARRQLVTIVNNAAGVTQGGFYRVEEYAFFCFLGSAKPVPYEDDLLLDESKSNSTPLWFSLIRYGGINALPSKRPGLVYPIAIDSKRVRIAAVGRTLKERVDANEIAGDLDSWKPDPSETLKGLPLIWPFRANGLLSTWQLKPDTLLYLADEGFVRIRPQENGPGGNLWSISYIKSGNQAKIRKNEIPVQGRDPDNGPYILGDAQRLVVPKTVWKRARHDAGKWGSRTIRELLGNVSFDYAKSPYAVLDALAVVVGDRPDALILDFFAGSCTTLHATAFLNLRDNGRRQCILVTNNEVEERHARQLEKEGIYPGDPEFESKGIAEIVAWPRCKHMLNGHRDDKTPIPGTYATGRDIQDGFAENLEYFRLDFVDPEEVERGGAFEGILPILWMMAGCIGARDSRRGASSWYIAKCSPFAILIQETKFLDFQEKIKLRADIKHIFLITDSEENFMLMRKELGRGFHCMQLYKSYLENFRINAATPELTGED